MFWFKRAKEHKSTHEINLIDEEISRSKRFEFHFAVLVLELSHSLPRGLSKLLPGKAISFHILKKNLRVYDKLTAINYRRYYIILPQTDEAGVSVVKERIYRLAREHNWGDINIGISVYPEDGECAQSLLEKAGYVFPSKLKCSRGKETQSSASDMVRP